jgi:hypothetical protein
MMAIGENRVFEFDYNGTVRQVEVHAVGISSTGAPCLRGWQVNGGSLSGNHAGWKLFDLDKVPDTFKLTDIPAEVPRPGYKKGDSSMLDIFKEV